MKRILYLLLFSSITSFAQESGTSAVSKVVDAVQSLKPWENQFCVTVDGVFPVGSTATNLGSGLGFNMIYYYHVFSHYQFLSFGIGYYSMSYASIADYHYSTIPIQVGYRYNFEIRSVQPYLGFELGGFYTTSVILSDTVRTSTDYKTQTAFLFGVSPKTGVRIPMDKNVDIDAHIKYNMVFDKPDMTQFITLGLGVSFRFDTKQ